MPKQQYIKYLYAQEDLSISQINARVSVDWRTVAKYAKKDGWNFAETARKRHRPILDPFMDTIDVWLLEDRLLPRKVRRTAKTIWIMLKRDHAVSTVRKEQSELTLPLGNKNCSKRGRKTHRACAS